MTQLLISNMDEALFQRLQQQAAVHGRTVEAEANTILAQALQPSQLDPWAAVDAIRERLAATGQTFSDSAELIRGDRDR